MQYWTLLQNLLARLLICDLRISGAQIQCMGLILMFGLQQVRLFTGQGQIFGMVVQEIRQESGSSTK